MKYFKIIISLAIFFLMQTSLLQAEEKLVLIGGLDYSKIGQCSDGKCEGDDKGYLLWENKLGNSLKLLDSSIVSQEFNWSGDPISHNEGGNSLKDKFEDWFYDEICSRNEACNLSIIAHSWGTIIASDFIASLPSDTSINIRTIVTYGSPVTGAQIKYNVDPFWKTAIKKVKKMEGKWINVVNENDIIAWNIPGVLNYKANGTISYKKSLKELFPVSGSEFDPKYLGTSILRQCNPFQKCEVLKSTMGLFWEASGFTIDSVPNTQKALGDYFYNTHFTQNYEPKRLVNYIKDGIGISRADALKSILDKFDISSTNAGFNSKIFGNDITVPSDVSRSTKNYDYIVTAYNRGITNGNNGKFRPSDSINLAEFLIMLIRTIPIPTDNPKYDYYDYHHNDWYYKYAKAAYNARLIENKDYSFNGTITSSRANEILSKALTYFKGRNSGISIYAKWSRKYADIDLYLYSKYNGNKDIKVKDRVNKDLRITNMQELKTSGGIVYWNKHSSDWGANLDYDSWGGNSQPWTGIGEERITVDSKMVRRPGTYSIILCYYSGWENSSKPNSASVEWWGINRGEIINTGGVNFNSTIAVGECMYVGTLNTSS